MVDNIVVRSPGASLPKPVAGLAFVTMWAVAIVLWSIAHLITNPQLGAFVVDTGLVLVSVGLAILFVEWRRTAVRAMLFGLVAIVLFLISDLADITVIVYMLRIIVPLFAFFTPVNRIANGFRIFA
ncbi:hypothetical protein [Subtercola boreus]|uniref:Uncharacterized protein n=1 Tax=Subtercola boreus TaxID=120213 RepID=A0A3E0WEC9_9MICO|nr:hypothetical protein [Subtercola boreus]RFA23384.1 hypothetical protein B7R24_00325 [Subtercola boreus]RFA23777.1 hypothetical protein B7R23_00325 [Subtercola boreus]RFA29478.1 hypothetical protein B7R25_00320 [Subtercola boreus]